MTSKEKAEEYLSQYSKEKSIDIAKTMKWYAKEFQETMWVDFWTKVISILKKSSNNQVPADKCTIIK